LRWTRSEPARVLGDYPDNGTEPIQEDTFDAVDLVGVLVTVGVVSMVGMRTKYPPVPKAVRQMSRAFWNPRAMCTAGQPGAMASVIQNRCRTSGTPYETPIGPFPTDDGFVIALPYGTTPDWMTNEMAAGSAVIVHERDTIPIVDPEVIPDDIAFPYVPQSEHSSLRAFDVDQFLRVRRVE